MWLQASATAEQMADAGADAASSAVDRVADAEQQGQANTEGASASGLGSPHTAFEASDAVLQQRTYFVPTMVYSKHTSQVLAVQTCNQEMGQT